MLCKNRITLIGFLGQDAETRSTPNGNPYTRFHWPTSVSWRENGHDEYKTRTEWHEPSSVFGRRAYQAPHSP
jgi:single-strand DNA-binding protein